MVEAFDPEAGDPVPEFSRLKTEPAKFVPVRQGYAAWRAGARYVLSRLNSWTETPATSQEDSVQFSALLEARKQLVSVEIFSGYLLQHKQTILD